MFLFVASNLGCGELESTDQKERHQLVRPS